MNRTAAQTNQARHSEPCLQMEEYNKTSVPYEGDPPHTPYAVSNS